MSNRDLLRRPHFVPALLIIVNTLSNLLTYLVSLPILLVLLVLYGRDVLTLALLALPLVLLIQGLFIVGLSLIIATLNVFYRDVQHIMTVMLSLLFYLTPVFYRPQQAGESYQLLFAVNPMAALIQSYRAIFFYGSLPAWHLVLLASVISVVMCGLGYIIYSYEQHKVMDAI